MTLFDVEQAAAAPEGPSLRVRLLVAYDGGGFRGFAPQQQPGVRTVGGELITALSRVLRQPVEITCSGRTDAGVHGWGQVVTFDVAAAEVDLVELQRSLNRQLGPAVVVRDAGIVDAGFDARRSAVARVYRYTVLNRPVPDPFRARTAWHVEVPLDVRAMELACDPLIGSHDFRAFCRQPSGGPPGPLVRRVIDAGWDDLGDGVLRFQIEANAFCHQMVRSVVGTVVEMGMGKKRPGDMAGIIRSGNRRRAGQPAPPHGLCLWEVRFEEGHSDGHGSDDSRPSA